MTSFHFSIRMGTDPGAPRSVDLFASSLVRVGRFRCPAGDRRWGEENRIEGGPVIAFPRRAVEIRAGNSHEAGGRVIADAARVMFYNEGQCYHRRLLDPAGDACEWLSPAPPVLDEILEEPGAGGRFARVCGPSDGRTYATVRGLAACLAATDAPAHDPLRIEEAALVLAARAVRFGAGERERRCSGRVQTRRAHAEAVESAREYIAVNFRRRLLVSDVARAAHVSAFHLCRIFREYAGMTLHACVLRCRLAAALDALEDPALELAPLAFSLGFSSHAHLTSAFTRTFGVTPSRARESGRLRDLAAWMSKVVEAR